MTDLQRPRRLQWQFVLAVVALAAIWLAMLIGGTGPLDRAVYEAIYAGHHPLFLVVARVFTALGEPTTLIGASIICALGLWYTGRGGLGLSFLLVTLLGRALSETQKYLVDRPRPALQAHLVVVKTQSFPSGHAMSSMVFYLALAMVLSGGSRWRPLAIAPAITLSMLIGMSRVMLGVHWPSDVIGGWSFGMLWVLLALQSAQRLLRAS